MWDTIIYRTFFMNYRAIFCTRLQLQSTHVEVPNSNRMNCSNSSLLECSPTTQATRVWFPDETCLTALQRQNTDISKQIFPEKEYRGLSPNFHIHVSVIDLYIPTIGLPILLEEICRPLLGPYKSLTDTWMWKLRLRPRYSQKRNT